MGGTSGAEPQKYLNSYPEAKEARGLKPTALTALAGSSRAAGFRERRKSRLTQVSCEREFRDRLKPVPKLPLAVDKKGFVGAQPCAPTGLNQHQVGFCNTLFSPRARLVLPPLRDDSL